jgi:actin-related protein 6
MCASGPTWRDNLGKRILLDNGAQIIKYSSAAETKAQTVYNAVGKDRKTRNVYLGNKLWEELENGHPNLQVTYPVIRGLLHDSDIETVIWKQVFSKFKKLEERASCLALTLPPLLPDIVQTRFAEIVFEDFEFDALFLASTHSMIREAAIAQHLLEPLADSSCHLVLDSGFSFTYGVPFFDGRPLKYAASRLDVGGKLLTNLLNE